MPLKEVGLHIPACPVHRKKCERCALSFIMLGCLRWLTSLQGLVEAPDGQAGGAEGSTVGGESEAARGRKRRRGGQGVATAAGEVAGGRRKLAVQARRVLPDRQARARAAAILRSAAQAASAGECAAGQQLHNFCCLST
jgi:hypothetical protein